jgi:hypothetical protein
MTELQAFYLRVSVHCDISISHSGVALSDSFTLKLQTEQTLLRPVGRSLTNDKALQHRRLESSRSFQSSTLNLRGQWSVIPTTKYVPCALLPTVTLCRTNSVTGHQPSPRVGLTHFWHNEGARNPEVKTHVRQDNNVHKIIVSKQAFSPPPMIEPRPAA